MTNVSHSITIRPAYSDDHAALARLAVLDSADKVPTPPVLLAEVDGELRAAVSLTDASAVADPFFPTAYLLRLLRDHAVGAEFGHERRRPAWRLRLRYA